MNAGVASRTRYLGVMRGVGMSGTQLDKMVWAEAVTYSLTGCIIGCCAGIALQKALITKQLSRFHIVLEFHVAQIGLIFLLILLIGMLSVISPLKRIKAQSVSEVIGSL